MKISVKNDAPNWKVPWNVFLARCNGGYGRFDDCPLFMISPNGSNWRAVNIDGKGSFALGDAFNNLTREDIIEKFTPDDRTFTFKNEREKS